MKADVAPFDPSEPGSFEKLQIVLKVVERCNINCTYCYYFNMGETTPMGRPPMIKVDTIRSLARWVAQGCRELRIGKVLISFHGGEPMMLKPRHFREMCEILRAQIGPVAELTFSMQTNGTILNDTWLSILREYAVRVGVSIDGDREAHDRYRLSHKGQSTFDLTETNLKRLAGWADGNPRMMPATISVLDGRNDYKRIYRYLRGLGVEQMHFLLPDRNADDPPTGEDGSSVDYGKALYDIFEAWLTEDNPQVFVKYVHRALEHFQFRQPVPQGVDVDNGEQVTSRRKRDYQIIVVRSDGTVAVNDSYIPALSWYARTPVYSITSHSLRDFLGDDIFAEIEKWQSTLPRGCVSCRWKNICRGGDLENRFSKKTLFDNPSVYCDGYKYFYSGMCDLLTRNGYPSEAVEQRFGTGNG